MLTIFTLAHSTVAKALPCFTQVFPYTSLKKQTLGWSEPAMKHFFFLVLVALAGISSVVGVCPEAVIAVGSMATEDAAEAAFCQECPEQCARRKLRAVGDRQLQCSAYCGPFKCVQCCLYSRSCTYCVNNCRRAEDAMEIDDTLAEITQMQKREDGRELKSGITIIDVWPDD